MNGVLSEASLGEFDRVLVAGRDRHVDHLLVAFTRRLDSVS